MSIKFWGIGAEGARLTGSQKVRGSIPLISTRIADYKRCMYKIDHSSGNGLFLFFRSLRGGLSLIGQ